MYQHLLEQPLNPDFSCILPGKVRSLPSAKRAIPEPPDSEKAGFARSGDIYGVFWSPRFGACCPQCGSYTKRAYRHLPWQGPRKTRYHRCPACDFRFKSIATDIQLEGEPSPEQLRFLRKYGK